MASKDKTKAWKTQCLSPRQQAVLLKLAKALDSEPVYLGGGTAIALYLGHRQSLDLDWFSYQDFGDPLLLAEDLRKKNISLEVLSVDKGTLHVRISGIKVSFLQYSYQLLHSLNKIEQFGCSIASLDDLGCMKLSAVAQRGSKKDFIDIYALTQRHQSLLVLLESYQKKYAIENVAHVLYGLAYFDDADREQTPTLLWRTDWRRIKSHLKERLKEAAKSLDYGGS